MNALKAFLTIRETRNIVFSICPAVVVAGEQSIANSATSSIRSKRKIVVQLASCITRDNYHGLPCPHIDYLKELIGKLGLDVCEDTTISDIAEKCRKAGIYNS